MVGKEAAHAIRANKRHTVSGGACMIMKRGTNALLVAGVLLIALSSGAVRAEKDIPSPRPPADVCGPEARGVYVTGCIPEEVDLTCLSYRSGERLCAQSGKEENLGVNDLLTKIRKETTCKFKCFDEPGCRKVKCIPKKKYGNRRLRVTPSAPMWGLAFARRDAG